MGTLFQDRRFGSAILGCITSYIFKRGLERVEYARYPCQRKGAFIWLLKHTRTYSTTE